MSPSDRLNDGTRGAVLTAGETRRKKACEYVTSLDRFELLPESARRVLALSNDPNFDLKDLVHTIEVDQALATKILKIANSPFYGMPRQVTTLRQATLMLGARAVRDLVVSTAALDAFSGKDDVGRQLWEHALGVSVAARLIWETAPHGHDPAGVAMCGLLHDIGKMVLLRASGRAYRDLYARGVGEGTPLAVLEVAEYGCDHAEVGALLASSWSLAPSVEASIFWHHRFEAAREGPQGADAAPGPDPAAHLGTIAVVDAANRLCGALGIGYQGKARELELGALPACAYLGVTERQLKDVAEKTRAGIDEVRAILS